MFARVIIAATLAAALPAPPPLVAPQPVTDRYPGGHTVVDPYRRLERLADPAVQAIFRREGAYTRDVLARLGEPREALRANIAHLVNARASVSGVVRGAHAVFYLERPPGANDARLMVREDGKAPRVLLDPDELGRREHATAHLSISNVLPSDDDALVAVGIVPGGAEYETHTRIVRTATGEVLPDDLPHTWFGASAWSLDGTTLFANQMQSVAPGNEAERELDSRVIRHRIGSTDDAVVFGIGYDPNVPMVPTDAPIIAIPSGSSYALGIVQHGVQNEQTIYTAPVASVVSGGPVAWRKIIDVDDDVTAIDVHDHTAYLLSHRGAPRFKVEALDLSDDNATAASAATVVPQQSGVIQGIAVAADALYVRGIDGGPAFLRKLPWTVDGTTGAPVDVALPFAGTIDVFALDGRSDGAYLGLSAWTKPLLIDRLDARGGLRDTGILKPPPIDTTKYTSVEVRVPSTGGAEVPVSIVYRRDMRRDGTNPTYLEAYGAYGLDIDPYFLGPSLAWLDAGGIWVVAHVRGGGEEGEAWHLAGKGPTKLNTVDDAVATARYLIAQHYTSPAHLAIEGTSAGGIMVNGAITRHPELFAAALDVVGMADTLRSQTEPNGPGNIPEFGSTETPAGFAALDAMDAYAHIRPGVRYPALMGVTGINDPRVAPWQVAKMVARLRAATASERPVLMRVDYDGGHGLLAASSTQEVSLLTDEFSFLLWQCGSPAFAGVPRLLATTHR